MLNVKKIKEQIEDGGIIELTDEYGLRVTNFSTDVYLKLGRKSISIKQRIQRESKSTSDFYISLDENETKDLYSVLKVIFEGSNFLIKKETMKKIILWFNEKTIDDLKILQVAESNIEDFNEYLEGIIKDHLKQNDSI